ncbi:aryl-sulfate sulfotransferase [Candidatus Amarolinea dominans]|uniref:aryl-sulfate sulfotransferase n=1 Tax=Candidatus Amarolinea dominans TaxID=3140696 RepID=UPI0031358821|nr:aryl-sulfate sulfotransferase [Anaerolineae bacterium]
MNPNLKLLLALALGLTAGLTLFSALASPGQEPLTLVYISPQPAAQFVSANAAIAIRQGEEIERASLLRAGLFQVTGAQSGAHPGRTILADDRQTVIFEPAQPFTPGETVAVTVHPGLQTQAGRAIQGVSFQFTISAMPPLAAHRPPDETVIAADPDLIAAPAPRSAVEQNPDATPRYVTVPADFPAITVTVPASEAAADGFVFITDFTGPGLPTAAPYVMMVDNQGEPVYYRKLPPNQAGTDFRKWPNGQLTFYDRSVGRFHILDHAYATVGYYYAKLRWTDQHDFELMPNGNQRYLVYDPQQIDMSQIVPGGFPTATVYGLVVQELDPSRNILFEWRSWDHFAITDTNVSLTTPVIDYVHGNTVTSDLDGNILISGRHVDEITKINRQTGAVMWRWGGKRNQFTFINDSRGFSHQHDIRVQPNGHYTLYDNGNHLNPEYSRALEYVLDEEHLTATLVWEYRNTPDTYGDSMGNAQRRPNGNTVIGWGSGLPTLTEVTPSGIKAFELTMAVGHQSYRSYRFPWKGYPTWPPTLAAVTAVGRTTLYASWNGATEVASYRIYGGVTPRVVISLVGAQIKTSFETSTDITELLDDFCFFRVLPVDRQGHDMTYSNVVSTGSEACHSSYLPFLGQ